MATEERSDRRNIAALRLEKRGTRAKECRQPPEAIKGLSPESAERTL